MEMNHDGTPVQYHMDLGALNHFSTMKRRAETDGNPVKILADTEFKFVVGNDDSTQELFHQNFLLCYKPISLDADNFDETNFDVSDFDRVLESAMVNQLRLLPRKTKHTLAGTPIFSGDEKVRNTIRADHALKRKLKEACRRALEEAYSASIDLRKGRCTTATLAELRTYNFHSTESGSIEYSQQVWTHYQREEYLPP